MKKIIEKIKIVKFKSLKNKTINLSPDLNIITGDNGTGKTNLLESIIFATNNQVESNIKIRHFEDKDFEVKIYSEYDKDFDVILIDNCGNDLSQNKLKEFVESLKEKSKTKQIIAV